MKLGDLELSGLGVPFGQLIQQLSEVFFPQKGLFTLLAHSSLLRSIFEYITDLYKYQVGNAFDSGSLLGVKVVREGLLGLPTL